MSTKLPEIFTLVLKQINPKSGNQEESYTAGTVNPDTGEKMTLADYLGKFFGWHKIKVAGSTKKYMEHKHVMKLINKVTRAELQRNKMAIEAQSQSMKTVVDQLETEETVHNTNPKGVIKSIDFGKASSNESFNIEAIEYDYTKLKELNIDPDVLDSLVLEVEKIVNTRANNQAKAMEEAGKENLQQSA